MTLSLRNRVGICKQNVGMVKPTSTARCGITSCTFWKTASFRSFKDIDRTQKWGSVSKVSIYIYLFNSTCHDTPHCAISGHVLGHFFHTISWYFQYSTMISESPGDCELLPAQLSKTFDRKTKGMCVLASYSPPSITPTIGRTRPSSKGRCYHGLYKLWAEQVRILKNNAWPKIMSRSASARSWKWKSHKWKSGSVDLFLKRNKATVLLFKATIMIHKGFRTSVFNGDLTVSRFFPVSLFFCLTM